MKNLIAPLKGKSILIVDDEIEIREAIIFDFKRAGCNIFQAGSGEEALKILENIEVDIVISDVRMPNGDGIDLIKKIRFKDPDKPIVLLATGFSDLSEPEAIKLGAQALLNKPLDRRMLFGVLAQLISA